MHNRKNINIKKNRRNIPIKTKKDILNALFVLKQSNKDICKNFNVSRSEIYNIIKRKDKILSVNDLVTQNINFKKISNNSIPEIEHELYKWINYCLTIHLIITDNIIRSKAIKIYEKLKDNDYRLPNNFKFSNGWLSNFKNRYNLTQRIINGENSLIDKDFLKQKIVALNSLLSKYKKENIYNADESGLFYRMLPNRTIAHKNENIKGIKKIKSRITILFTCNATGTVKFKPLIIGKSKKPKDLRGINIDNLDLTYRNSKKAWMTNILWREYILDFEKFCTEPSILLIDNCSAHLIDYDILKLKYLTVYFLPPNTTSFLQPCDAGIIKTFKTYYRTMYIENLISQVESGNVNFKLSLYDAFVFIKTAWESVTQETIINCWNHTQIISLRSEINSDIITNTCKENNIDKYSELCDIFKNKLKRMSDLEPNYDMTVQEYISFDENEKIAENLSDSDIINIKPSELLINNEINLSPDEVKKIKENLIHYCNSKDNFINYINSMNDENKNKLYELFYTLVKEKK
jgi:hypothetical protein